MSQRTFTQLDVFTDTPLRGNPLAVVHAAQGLSEALLLLPHKIRAKQKEQHPLRCCSWCDREDSNLWPSGSEPNALSS